MKKISIDYHVHSSLTDGNMSIEQIARRCDRIGIKEVAIVEHVRKKLDYDFGKFLESIEKANSMFKFKVIPAIESKILDASGTLDFPEGIKHSIKFIMGVVHTLPAGMTKKAAYRALIKSECDIIGHPVNIPESLIPEIRKANKVIELNEKHRAPSETFIKKASERGVKFSVGSDAHNLSEIGNYNWVNRMVNRYNVILWRI
jgi:putative hydrolase